MAERLTELASGVDALYLSGWSSLRRETIEQLTGARAHAEASTDPVYTEFGNVEWQMRSRAFGKHHFWLTGEFGQLGVTTSESLPTFRIQPKAEFLHGLGSDESVEWVHRILEAECGPTLLTVSRIDLHADLQGWKLIGDDRRRFVCQAASRILHEEGETFTGFEFGRRTSKTVCCRIYDKTVEMAAKGTDYWLDIWGASYVDVLPVVRVEFEIHRSALREYGVDTPEDVLAASGALWADLTASWLTYRDPTSDETRSRWPVASEWDQVRRARLADGAFGISRMREGRNRGDLRRLLPALVGYLAKFAAISGAEDWRQTADKLSMALPRYCIERGVPFRDRIEMKRQDLGLR